MSSVVQQKKKRGRPRKRYPPRGISVWTFGRLTGWSRSKIFNEMAAGRLRYSQSKPGAARDIHTTELVRLEFIESLNELLPP